MKRPRLDAAGQDYVPRFELLKLLSTLPKDLGVANGDPLSLAILRFLGHQRVAACCRSALEWWTSQGRRFVLCLNDERRGAEGPFAPLERVLSSHVESVRLGRYGRQTVEERAHIIVACSHSTMLRCTYSKLTGLGVTLAQHKAMLSLRVVRLQQCRLEAADLIEFFACVPHLERMDVFNEALGGLGPLLRCSTACHCRLRSMEFTDCGLGAEDAGALLEVLGPELRTVHLQADNLRGLRFCNLPHLENMNLLDCNLSRADAIRAMAHCPNLETLALCGNPLAEAAKTRRYQEGVGSKCSSDEEEIPGSRDHASSADLLGAIGRGSGAASEWRLVWPAMPRLQRADLRQCGLGREDEEDLLGQLPGTAPASGLELLVLAAATTGLGGPGGGSATHIVFESSSESGGDAD